MRTLLPSKESAKQHYAVLEKILGYRRIPSAYTLQLHNTTWWRVFAPLKWPIFVSFVIEIIVWVFIVTGPIMIARGIERGDTALLGLFSGLFLITWLLGVVGLYWYIQATARGMVGLEQSSVIRFLRADPIHHSTRSTGKIISKIENGITAMEDIPDIFVFNLVPVVVSPLVLIGSLYLVDARAGLLVAGVFAGIVIPAILGQFYMVRVAAPAEIKAKDSLKEAGLDTLTQYYLVRSTLSTLGRLSLIDGEALRLSVVRSTTWMAFEGFIALIRLVYTLLSIGLTYYLAAQVQAGLIDSAIAIGIAIALYNAYPTIVNAGRQMEKFLTQVTRLKDLLTYIDEFGGVSIPLEVAESRREDMLVKVKAEKVSFEYAGQEVLLEGHSLKLTEPGLYGLIGPSGTGKTTLLSILGGQLRPTAGRVFIDGYDVYRVGENTRRDVLALQQQTSSNIRGSLHDNLVFGLPPQTIPGTGELIDVLKRVGLWDLFRVKDGLETFIGEGGVTLSGGQRQRLNFASLYLRACHYQPTLILIDEPTSSLDEVSERQITAMIGELSESAVTIVVAHRLKTIEAARGIYDTSLLSRDVAIEFVSPTQLQQASAYYRAVLDGTRILEE